MTEDLIIQKNGRVGHISLNRPKVIHSLNLDMCLGMIDALQAKTKGLVEVFVDTAGLVDDFDGMIMGELDFPAAQHMLGPREHARIGCALAEKLQDISIQDIAQSG